MSFMFKCVSGNVSNACQGARVDVGLFLDFKKWPPEDLFGWLRLCDMSLAQQDSNPRPAD